MILALRGFGADRRPLLLQALFKFGLLKQTPTHLKKKKALWYFDWFSRCRAGPLFGFLCAGEHGGIVLIRR